VVDKCGSSQHCDCKMPADTAQALEAFRRERLGVAELAAELLRDGAPSSRADLLIDPVLDHLLQANGTDRSIALNLLWELTVDPRVPSTLGLRADAPESPAPVTRQDCTNDPQVHTRASRRVLRSRWHQLIPLLTMDAESAGPVTAVLSTLHEDADAVAPQLIAAFDQSPPGTAQRSAILLAGAVLAGSAPGMLPGYYDWFNSVFAGDPDGGIRQAAALGLRNIGWPQPPSGAVSDMLTDGDAMSELDLTPWVNGSANFSNMAVLLLDWPDPLTRHVRNGMHNTDSDVRASAVSVAWKGLRRWRRGTDELSTALAEAVGDPEPFVAEQAASVVCWLPHVPRQPLYDAFRQSGASRRIRAYALLGLGRAGDERVVEELISEVRTPALIAAVGPAVAGLRRHADGLVAAIGDYLRLPSSQRNTKRTASVLSTIADWPEAAGLVEEISALVDAAAGPEVYDALGAISEVSDDTIAQIRRAAENHQSPLAQAAAIKALWRVTGESSLPSLGMMLNGSLVEELHASLAAAVLGPAAMMLSGRLTEIATSTGDAQVASAASMARLAIDPGVPVRTDPFRTLLQRKRDAELALDALAMVSRPDEQTVVILQAIVDDELRYTWPRSSDKAIVDDERIRATTVRILQRVGS
jgi:hypothetical protein